MRQIAIDPSDPEARGITLFDRASGRIAIRAAAADDDPADLVKVKIDGKSKSGEVAVFSARAALAGLGFIIGGAKGKARPPSFSGLKKAIVRLGGDAPAMLMIRISGDGDEPIGDEEAGVGTLGEARPRFGANITGRGGGDEDGDDDE